MYKLLFNIRAYFMDAFKRVFYIFSLKKGEFGRNQLKKETV